jgi:hypothetical protein
MAAAHGHADMSEVFLVEAGSDSHSSASHHNVASKPRSWDFENII